ncbi:MAG: sigma-70 family RNA polymerase sigma factor [Candidatus Acidiferrales bacterium]
MDGLRRTQLGWQTSAENRGPEAAPESPQATERRLIERAQKGDHEAFRALVERHQRRVFSVIAHLLRRPADVEDIAQQVFLKAYLALPRFDFRAAFSTWLYRIAVNECYDQMRRHRAQKAPGDSEVPLGDPAEWERLEAEPGQRSSEIARGAEARQLVEALLQRLAPEDRTLVALRELEGFSIEEIAAMTKLKANTVKVRLFRARRRLVEIHRRFFARRPGGK